MPSAVRLQFFYTVVLGAASLVALAGCAVGPNFHPPAAPRDAGYTTAPLPDATASAGAPGGDAQRFVSGLDVEYKWWEAFGSPAIDSLVEQAFRANPSVAAAKAALGQAQELVYAQDGYFFPSVSADYNVERQKLAGNLTGSSAPGVQGNGTAINAVQSATPPYNEPLYFNFHTATLTVGFTPDVFGLNRRKVESLDAQKELQRFELEATYVSLASNVVAAAIQEASTRAQIKATQDIIEENEKALTVMRDKFNAGFAMRIDLATEELQLAEAQALLPPLTKQFEQNRNLIRALVGHLPNQDVAETIDFDALTLPAELPLSLPSKIIEQRPDVRAAQEQVRSANAQVGVALAQMLPQFTITGAVGGTATLFSQMFKSGGPFWTLIGDASQPLFEGGTLLHTKRAADQALREAAAQYQSTVLQAYQNVADALHAVLTDAEAFTAALAAERAAKALLDVTHQRAVAGYTDYLTDLAAQIAYNQAVLSLAQARAMRLGDTAALYQALGGGWWNRSSAANGAAHAAVTALPVAAVN
jgi:NodT family efflux transporter outer membrane factor (OMF) lipoprotein